MNYSALAHKFPNNTEDELDSSLVNLCWVVNGLFTIKGIIRYRNDIRVANARDRICYAINKNIIETNSQTKKSSVSNLATCGSDNKWVLITPPLNDDETSTKPDLINEIHERLEQRVISLKKCRSPSRSPARVKSPQKALSSMPVKSSPAQSPQSTKAEFHGNSFKTEPMDQNHQNSVQSNMDIKSERNETESPSDRESPAIFTGPTVSELEAITSSIMKLLKRDDEPVQLTDKVVTELGLKQTLQTDTDTLPNGSSILVFPDKLVYWYVCLSLSHIILMNNFYNSLLNKMPCSIVANSQSIFNYSLQDNLISSHFY